jgi:Tfp pilus assembly protein PilF
VPTAGNWNKLGVALLQWDQHERAEEAFLRAIALDNSEPAPFFHLGQLHMERGYTLQAIEELEHYLRIAPEGQFRDEAQRMLTDIRESDDSSEG